MAPLWAAMLALSGFWQKLWMKDLVLIRVGGVLWWFGLPWLSRG